MLHQQSSSSSDKEIDAIKLLKDVVSMDPSNLNALQDLITIYKNLGKLKEAKKYEEMFKAATGQSSQEQDIRMRFARCQAEQAYALTKDINTRTWTGVDIREKLLRSFQTAFDIAGYLVTGDEKRDWVFQLGYVQEGLCHVYFRSGRYDQSLEAIGHATQNLHQVLQMCDDKSKALQADVWFTLGNAFAGNDKLPNPEIPDIIKEHYIEEWMDPDRCYERSLKFEPDLVWTLGRLGISRFKKRNFQGALEDLDRAMAAVEHLPEDNHLKRSSWNALCHRAKVYIELASDKSTSAEDSLRYLKAARDDSTRCVQYMSSPFTIAVNGEVHSLIASHPQTDESEVEDMRYTALNQFHQAALTQDGRCISHVHLKWAQCLTADENLRSAIERYKEAFYAAHGEPYTSGVASELLETMLQLYRDSAREESIALKGELAYWLEIVYTYYREKDLNFSRFSWRFEYSSELLNAMEHLVDPSTEPTGKQTEFCRTVLDDMRCVVMEEEENWDDAKRSDFNDRLEALIRQNEENINRPHGMSSSSVQGSPKDFHKPPDKPRAAGVSYDFFIISDEDNKEHNRWVRHALLTGLESHPHSLKGYYHGRAPLGTLELKPQEDAIEDSANIIIVLSRNALQLKDLLIEMMKHINRDTKKIVLHLDDTEVPTSLSVLCEVHVFDFRGPGNMHLSRLARCLLPDHPW